MYWLLETGLLYIWRKNFMFLLYLYESMRKEEPSGYATIIPFGIVCMLPVLIPAIEECFTKYGVISTIIALIII